MSPVTNTRQGRWRRVRREKEKQPTASETATPPLKRRRRQKKQDADDAHVSSNKSKQAESVVEDTSESTTKKLSKRARRFVEKVLPKAKKQIDEHFRRMGSAPKGITYPPGFIPYGGMIDVDYAPLEPHSFGSLAKRKEKDVTYEFGENAASLSGGTIVEIECMDPSVIRAAHKAIFRHNMTTSGKKLKLSLAAIIRVNSESLRPEFAGSYYYITLVANDKHGVMGKYEAKVFSGAFAHYIKLFRPALQAISFEEIEKGERMRHKMGL